MHDLDPLIAHLLGGARDKTNPDYCVDRLDKLMLKYGYCLHENVCMEFYHNFCIIIVHG